MDIAPDTRVKKTFTPKRVALRVAFALCVLGGMGIVFLPIGWQINRFIVWLYYQGRAFGVPDFVTISWYEFALNALLFALPIFLGSLLWPRIDWWIWLVVAALASLTVEVVQLLFLPREFSLFDIIANVSGACVASLIAVFAKKFRNSGMVVRKEHENTTN